MEQQDAIYSEFKIEAITNGFILKARKYKTTSWHTFVFETAESMAKFLEKEALPLTLLQVEEQLSKDCDSKNPYGNDELIKQMANTYYSNHKSYSTQSSPDDDADSLF